MTTARCHSFTRPARHMTSVQSAISAAVPKSWMTTSSVIIPTGTSIGRKPAEELVEIERPKRQCNRRETARRVHLPSSDGCSGGKLAASAGAVDLLAEPRHQHHQAEQRRR